MSQIWYEEYKKIKLKFDYSYKGYNLMQLIPGYLSVDLTAKPTMRNLLKIFYLSNKTLDLPKALEVKEPTLISYLINRPDYRDLVCAAQMEYPNSQIVALASLPTIRISPFRPFFMKHLFLALRLAFFHSIGNGIRYRFHFTAVILKLLNQIYLLERTMQQCTINRYVCFNSAFKEESILTSYFNKRGVETVSLQHGIFCKFKLFIPFDVINEDNLIAQKMLCWGQSTIDYLTVKGFDSSRLILTGNLKYKNIKIGEVNQEFKICLVLLGRETYVETNNKLLATLTQYNKLHDEKIMFYIKKHPFLAEAIHKEYADDYIVFLEKDNTVQEILKSNKTDFSIAVNTTAYYESLIFSKPCLRWTESENEEFDGMDDKFANLRELDAQIEHLKNMDANEIKEQVEQVIKYVFNPNL